MNEKISILVVEDEVAIQTLLQYSLQQEGFEINCVASAELAIASIKNKLPSVLLLDQMLPGMNGIALAKILRNDQRTRELPLIMVTARLEEAERIAGLNVGADDYVTKPFSPRELAARIRAVLRRRAPHLGEQTLEIGQLKLNSKSHQVTYCERDIHLGPSEFSLLLYFMTHRDVVLSREQLLNALRGDHIFLEDRTIDVYIRRLRAALGQGSDNIIQTVRGFGYKLSIQ